jgi:hypothetical protein
MRTAFVLTSLFVAVSFRVFAAGTVQDYGHTTHYSGSDGTSLNGYKTGNTTYWTDGKGTHGTEVRTGTLSTYTDNKGRNLNGHTVGGTTYYYGNDKPTRGHSRRDEARMQQSTEDAIVEGAKLLVDADGNSLLIDYKKKEYLFDTRGTPQQILENAQRAAFRLAFKLGANQLVDSNGKSLLYDTKTEKFLFDTSGTAQQILDSAIRVAQKLRQSSR